MPSNWNLLMERLAATGGMSSREVRVTVAIARKTLGFRKTRDLLSTSQLEKLTGIKRQHITETLPLLERRGVIVRTGGGAGRAATIELQLERPWVSGTCTPIRTGEPAPSRGQVETANLHPLEAKPAPPSGHTREKEQELQGSTLLVQYQDAEDLSGYEAWLNSLTYDEHRAVCAAENDDERWKTEAHPSLAETRRMRTAA